MQVSVDFDSCMSTGGCAQLAPDVFEIGADGFLYVLVESPAPALHADVRAAADLCPTGAITLTD